MEGEESILHPAPNETFTLIKPPGAPAPVHFAGEARGHADSISIDNVTFQRRKLGPEDGQSFRIQPSRSIDELRNQARAPTPPHHDGHFRQPDLLPLPPLDPPLHLALP